jgi:hypothetical protein
MSQAHKEARPRIALIHALRESLQPIWDAFAHQWPEAEYFNLLDDSLSVDREREGRLTPAIERRFLTLGRYAAGVNDGGRKTGAILFTCSAFGPAIDAVKRDLAIPVLRPNEAAFERALEIGPRIALLVTFGPSLVSLSGELDAMAAERGKQIALEGRLVEGALAALQAGDGAVHDRLISAAVDALPPVDAIVLGQFSMARAAKICGARVLTTPDAAVAKLRALA